MPRFKLNRWWTLILTLCLGCALVGSIPTRAMAANGMLDETGGATLGSGGGIPPPPGAGDPDTPMSSGKRARDGAVRPAASLSTERVAGDGMRVDSVMMWHFRVVLQSLRNWSFIRL